MKYIKKYKYLITLVILLGIISWGYLVKRNLNENSIIINEELTQEIDINKDIQNENVEEELVTVDIKGAIKNPGVYSVKKTAIINDVVKMAGGLTKKANTSLINLAKRVTNEMVIIIYTDEEVKKSNVVDTVVQVVEKECVCPNIKNDGCINTEIDETISNKVDKLININTASLEELMSLSGVGEAKAKAIISYRETKRFEKIEDILNVSGFGETLYEQIKIYITT